MFNGLRNYLETYAIIKTRDQLMQMTDRQLEDVGISRNLLEKGTSAWPWREATAANSENSQPGKMSAREINKAVRELSGMSDKQLRDIGVSRGTIRHSVEQGVDNRGPGPQRAA